MTRGRVMVQASGVGVRLDGERVLDDVWFSVAAGEWLGVVGPNGAGKSTLLRALAGLCRYAGRVEIADRELATLRPRELARLVAMVMQTPVVPTGITVVDYVLLGRAAHLGVLQRDGRRDRRIVADVLDALELSGFAGRRLETLSGGERQRVFLARALAQQPRLLLLDEPTAALDLGHQQDVLGLIDRLRRDQGLTVISTLHDLTLLGEYTDQVLLLHQGRVVRHGTPGEVITTDVIHRVYGASVDVVPPDPAAGRLGPAVIPLRPARR